MKTYRVEFPGTDHAPVKLSEGVNLSEHLTVENSPVLFGCRTGLCGTCLVEIALPGDDRLEPPGAEEVEALSIYAPGNTQARLACQIHLTVDIRLWKIESAC